MNYTEITYKTYKINEDGERVEAGDKVLRFKLTSGPASTLEKILGKSIIEYIQDESITTITTMLRYMRMFEDKTITINQAQEIYDELIDDGWTFKRILQDIIYETMVNSGFLERSEWEEMKTQTEELMKQIKNEQMKALKNAVKGSENI